MIAVVIPVFNQAAYLGEALDSVAAQTLAPAEVVVVDDGSTDGSADVAEARGIRTLRIENRGVGPARWAGAQLTTAPLIAFLDGDDLLAPRHHELLADAIGDKDAACGQVSEFAEPGTGAAERYEIRSAPRVAPLAGAYLVRREAYLALAAEDLVDREHDWFAMVHRLERAEVAELVMRRRIHGENRSLRDREHLHKQYLASARAAILRSRGERPS